MGRFDKENFLRCRKAAIVMVAFLFVEHMRMKQLEYDKYIINSLRVRFCILSRLMFPGAIIALRLGRVMTKSDVAYQTSERVFPP